MEIRAVREEEAEAGPDPFDRGLDLGLFVDGEIVEDHHVARPERRHACPASGAARPRRQGAAVRRQRVAQFRQGWDPGAR